MTLVAKRLLIGSGQFGFPFSFGTCVLTVSGKMCFWQKKRGRFKDVEEVMDTYRNSL